MKNQQTMNKAQALFDFDTISKQEEHLLYLIGTDEAGRGPAAGSVYAAAVCFFDKVNTSLFEKLNDSKKLNHKTRQELFEIIKQNSYYSIKSVSVEEIEKINILQASLLAMKMAVLDVIHQINKIEVLTLVDGNKLIKDFPFEQKYVIKGDSKSASIAAASILAKVSRDNYMDELDEKFPHYAWKNNKGYLTKAHIEAIGEFGTTPHHRLSFLKNIIKSPQ